MNLRTTTIKVFAAACVVGVLPSAQAQLIEDIDFRRDGANAVVQIRLGARVNFLRSVSARAGDLSQAYYDVLPQQSSSLASSERRVEARGAIPAIVLSDDAAAGNELNRKLVIRLSKPAKFRVRAGRDNRSIEVVFDGLAQSVGVAPATTVADTQRKFFITLQSSPTAGHHLEASVPAKLQDYQTFTASRNVDGQTVHDINLGYFATMQEAQAARELLSPRFPKAAINVVQTVPAAVVQTVPPAVVQAPPAASEPGAVASPQSSSASENHETLLLAAQSAYDRADYAGALESLNQLLNLPPNPSSRRAQELVGLTRLQLGDIARAKAEFDLFLSLYPTGSDSDRVRQTLAGMPASSATAPAQAQATPEKPPSPWSGSVSSFFYGGQAKTRSQEFQDSPLGGLPQPLGQDTISNSDQRQIQTSVDLNWRQRTDDNDTRFVLRDSHTANFLDKNKSKNRLSALYVDWRSIGAGTSLRLGRQSPTGGGVFHRFDGLQAGYSYRPKWKVNVMAGVPTEKLLDTRRSIYGAWIDADALTNEISGNVYVNQQVLDGQIDRRAVGAEMRYFNGGVSASAQLDYDVMIKGVNIASLQGTWQLPDNTVYNFSYDYRAIPILSLGTILFNQGSAVAVPATRLQDLLGSSSVTTLRNQVKGITAYQRQGLLGFTTPLRTNWQVGGDVRLTNTGEVRPVAVILPAGQASTGNQWSVGAQLIGSNLYSDRDTHVFAATAMHAPTSRLAALSYNNLSNLGNGWQLEPSLKFDVQTDDAGTKKLRLSPGMRVTYRLLEKVSLESELTYERSKSTAPLRNETTNQVFYYLGVRYDL
jgi:tetratricopeptide (TPR) repeat protein